LPTTGQRGGRYDPQPVTRSSEWVSLLAATKDMSFIHKPQYNNWPRGELNSNGTLALQVEFIPSEAW